MRALIHAKFFRMAWLMSLVLFFQTACAVTYHARIPLDEQSRKDIEKRIDKKDVLVKLKHEYRPKKGKVLKLDSTSLLFQNAQSETISYQAIDFIKIDRKPDLHGLLYGSIFFAGVTFLPNLLFGRLSDDMTLRDEILSSAIFFGVPLFIVGFTIGSLTHRNVVITFHPSPQK